jgi:uncharacterized membrane protein
MTRLARIRPHALAAIAAAALLPFTAVTPSAAADPPAASAAAEPGGLPSAPRVLPELSLGLVDRTIVQTARTGPSAASLLLDKGVYRPLPDVPGALQTTYLRNNNRGQVVGAYAVIDDAGTVRLRGVVRTGRQLTRIDVPGAAVTLPLGINDRGQVVGGYVEVGAPVDPATGESPIGGFVWANGRTRTFDVPGSISTAPYEINNRGQIVGHFVDARGAQHGFVLHKGRVTRIDHPRASDSPSLTGTRIIGVNDRGQLVGSYGDDRGIIRAWVWERGRFTTIHPRFGQQSEASQIDNRGRIVGRYFDPHLRSFLLDKGRYTRIDVPKRCDTAVLGINDRSQILIAAAGTTDGTTCPPAVGGNPRSTAPVFMLDKGRFSAFDPPGVNANELIDVNRRGQIAGTYVAKNGVSHGFLRDKRGRFTRFDFPGASPTYVLKLNDRGQIVGNACDGIDCPTQFGYRRDADGRFRSLRYPDAVSTQAFGINDRGRIVGSYLDTAGTEHGYVWSRGRFTTFDVPGASLSQLTAINNRGEMVGIYIDADGNPHGFYRSPRGRITTVDVPGAVLTVPFDINDRGRIVGFTTSALPLPNADEVHGFVLKNGTDSSFTRIDVPGAPRTLASGIDDRGRIVGIYENPNATVPESGQNLGSTGVADMLLGSWNA